MASSVRGRGGLGIGRSEMDASRLVFVFVQDAKPKRKVAVPVPDSFTWEQFIDKVTEKLKISGVGDIYLSASGVKVRSVQQLQDIDELCVVEAPASTVFSNGALLSADANGGPSTSSDHHRGGLETMGSATLRSQASERVRTAVSIGPAGSGGLGSPPLLPGAREDGEDKYVRRAHPLKRTLQRLLPGLFAPGLPVTNRDAAGEGDAGLARGGLRRRRGRRSPYTVQNLLAVLAVMCCVMTMLFYLFRLQPPAAAPMPAASNAHEAVPVAAAAAAGGGGGAAVAGGAVAPGGAAAAAAGSGAAAAGAAGGGGAPLAAGGTPATTATAAA